MILMMVAMVAAMQDGTHATGSRSQVEQAQKLFDERLLDYPSARFRDVTANDRVICGFVNSKNRLGAFVGWQGFVVVQTDGTSTLRITETGEQMPLVYELYCTENRTPVSRDYSDRLTHR